MAKQGNGTTRLPLWEDEAPAEFRLRRREQSVPGAGRLRRGAPGMTLEFDDPDEDGELRPARRGYGGSGGRWWRPATRAGRIFLAAGALLALSGFTAAGLMLKTYLERDARFRIAGTGDIQATGLSEVSRAQLLSVFGADIGRNVFFVPLEERRKDLEAIPWVQQATVMRLLPNRIRVAVVERQPVAFVRLGGQIGLVDANGVLLSMSPKAMVRRHYSFPVLTGIDPGDPAASRQARMAVYLRLMAALDSTGQHFSEQISEIDLTDPEDARVLMPEQGRDIIADFGDSHFLERYLRYQKYIAQWRQQYPNLASVDLRFGRQVVLGMASGKQASEVDADQAKPQAGEPEGGNAQGRSSARRSVQSGGKSRIGAKSSSAERSRKRTGQRARRAALGAEHRGSEWGFSEGVGAGSRPATEQDG